MMYSSSYRAMKAHITCPGNVVGLKVTEKGRPAQVVRVFTPEMRKASV